MKHIFLNGESLQVQATNLKELTQELASYKESSAIALNETFIPKQDYGNTPVQDKDRIELVVPMQGG